MKRLALSLLSLVFLAQAASAQHSPIAPEHPLKTGTEAPAFTLKDHEEKSRRLADFIKAGPVVLIFFRSADW